MWLGRSIPKREEDQVEEEQPGEEDEDEEEEEEEEEEEVEAQLRALDVSWKYLDVFDLFNANQQLREAITRLLGDGGDDFATMHGSSKDLTTVLNLLKRTNIRKVDMTKAEEALSGKTLPLDPEAIELLRSLRPMDPAEDWSKLLDLLDQEQGYMRIIFREYTSSEGSGDLELLSQNPWRQFCKDIRLLDKSKGVTKQAIDQIFVRANRDNADDVLTGIRSDDLRPGGVDETSRDLLLRVQPGRDQWQLDYEIDAKHLRQPEFVAALVRCANTRFGPMVPNLHEQMQLLFDENIMPNAGLPANDEADDLMDTDEMLAFFSSEDDANENMPPGAFGMASRIQTGFKKLCKELNEDNMDAAEMATINGNAFQNFLRDHGLLSRAFTAKDVRKIFVRVNLEDELYVQANKYDSSDGLTVRFQSHLPIFWLCFVLIFGWICGGSSTSFKSAS